jgi:hypothetical protein
VVMPGMVQVVINITLDLVAVAFSPTVQADHVFPHVVLAFLKWDMACLEFFLTLFQGKCANTCILHSLLTLVLRYLLILCLSIDAGWRPREHMAH